MPVNVFVAITEHGYTECFQGFIPFAIGFFLFGEGMLSSIQFDDDLFFGYIKINDVIFNARLPFYRDGQIF